MISFKPQSFNLAVYKPNSAINLDIKLLNDTDATTLKTLEIVAKRTPTPTPTSKSTSTPEPIVVKEKGLSKNMKIIGFSLLGVVLILTSVLVYKAVKKK